MSRIYDLPNGIGEPSWLKNINQMNRILNPAYTELSILTENLDYMSSSLRALQPAYTALQIPQIMQNNSFLLQSAQIFKNIQPYETFLSHVYKLNENNIWLLTS